MLLSLRIRNYALIDEMETSFDEGFSVMTGETGSGKSIILGALGLILGERADMSSINDQDQKCIVEGEFNIRGYGLKEFFKDHDLDYEDITLLRREIRPGGKSRAFINDTPVNLQQMKELGQQLVDVHSQHQTLMLKRPGFRFAVLDVCAGNEELINEYTDNFAEYTRLSGEVQKLKEEDERSAQDRDYYSFQFNELDEANLKQGELEDLESEWKIIEKSGEIAEATLGASQALEGDGGIVDRLGEVERAFDRLRSISPEFEELADRLKSSGIELKDIAGELDRISPGADRDPERIAEIEARLSTINSLLTKHRVQTVDELIALREELRQKLGRLGSLEEEISRKAKECQKAEDRAKAIAGDLRDRRMNAIPGLEKSIAGVLAQLSMPHAHLNIELIPTKELGPYGLDDVQFMFRTNKGGDYKLLEKIASGGELSRLMLALKAQIADKRTLPTIIFDEIDTGVGGEVANEMAAIMRKMAANMQVLSITHLPQIAGKGHHHYVVSKDDSKEKARTRIEKLEDDRRVEEVARMLSGEKLTDASLMNARELLKQ